MPVGRRARRGHENHDFPQTRLKPTARVPTESENYTEVRSGPWLRPSGFDACCHRAGLSAVASRILARLMPHHGYRRVASCDYGNTNRLRITPPARSARRAGRGCARPICVGQSARAALLRASAALTVLPGGWRPSSSPPKRCATAHACGYLGARLRGRGSSPHEWASPRPPSP